MHAVEVLKNYCNIHHIAVDNGVFTDFVSGKLYDVYVTCMLLDA